MKESDFYEFGKDERWTLQGYDLFTHKQRIKRYFRWTIVFFGVVEVILAAWPIIATAIWKFEASLTWIWLLYIPRVIILFWALISVTEIITLFGAGPRTRGNILRTLGAFAPSTALALWTILAWVGGVIIGVMFVLITVSVIIFDKNRLLHGLSIGIGVLSVIESAVAPFVVYHCGVYVPIIKAHNTEKKLVSKPIKKSKSLINNGMRGPFNKPGTPNDYTKTRTPVVLGSRSKLKTAKIQRKTNAKNVRGKIK